MSQTRIAEIDRRETPENVRAILLSLGAHVDADPRNSATIICHDDAHAEQVMADVYFGCTAMDGALSVWTAPCPD